MKPFFAYIFASSFFFTTTLTAKPLCSLFGYPLNSPIGMSANVMTTSKGIADFCDRGYDVITYKTIRTRTHPISSTTIYAVDVKTPLMLHDIGSTYQVQENPSAESVAITNSMGINSGNPDEVINDIALARAALHQGQILIVSIYGTGPDKKSMIEDFVAAAVIASKGGAHVIEANLSCPNLNSCMIYFEPDLVYEICSAITKALPSFLLTIKVGTFEDSALMRAVLKAAHAGGARGVCGINSVPVQVITADGDYVFGPEHAISGLSGAPIAELAVQFVRDARDIINQENLDLVLFATGGVCKPEDFDRLLAAGADIVMSSAGALANKDLALEYHTKHHIACDQQKRNLIKTLYKIGAIRFENILLQSGIISPIYFDLRVLGSHPAALRMVAQMMKEKIATCTFNSICGVPYAALPLAAALGLAGNYPLIMPRKEIKDHGTGKRIEGAFKKGDCCLVVEDLITSGASVLEIIEILEKEGLIVRDVLIIIDREQQGVSHVQNKGYNVHALCTISEILSVLLDEGLITYRQFATIKQFFAQHGGN